MKISAISRLLMPLLPLVILAGCNEQEKPLPTCKWCIPPDCAQQHSHKGYLPAFAGRGPCFALDRESITFVTAEGISKEKAEFKYNEDEDSWTAILQGAGGIKLTRIDNETLLFEDTAGLAQKYRMHSGKLEQNPISLPGEKANNLRKQAITLAENSKAGPEIEGKLIYATGKLKCYKPVVDGNLGTIANGIGHFALAEKYVQAGGVATDSKTAENGWQKIDPTKEEALRAGINSRHFNFSHGPVYSDDVRLGDWRVTREFLESVCGSVPMDIKKLNVPFASIQADGGKVSGNTIYFGQDPDKPMNGDIRIRYFCIPDSVTVTIIGTLKDGAFTSYKVDDKLSIGRLFMGKVPLKAMF